MSAIRQWRLNDRIPESDQRVVPRERQIRSIPSRGSSARTSTPRPRTSLMTFGINGDSSEIEGSRTLPEKQGIIVQRPAVERMTRRIANAGQAPGGPDTRLYIQWSTGRPIR